MKKLLVQSMINSGAMAIIRLQKTESILNLVEALLAGGINLIEISLNTDDPYTTISRIAAEFADEVILGAGTVISSAEVKEVLNAGARFIVTPITNIEIIRTCHDHNAPVCMGAFSPTEIYQVFKNNADIIKVFPASVLGPKFIKAIKEPFPSIPLMPTGGISPENAGEWIENGASLLGVGGSLCDKQAIESGSFREITKKAKTLSSNIAEARAARHG